MTDSANSVKSFAQHADKIDISCLPGIALMATD